MSKIHFLPVKYGDSFVIECQKAGQRGVVVVDGGPRGCGKILMAKVEEVGTPDLMVLTHYDDDHIGGMTQYIKTCNKENKLPAKEIWANCIKYAEAKDEEDTVIEEAPREIVIIKRPAGAPMEDMPRMAPMPAPSPVQAVKFARLVDLVSGKSNLTWRDDLIEGVTKQFPFASVEVVSPTDAGRRLAVGKQEIVAEKMKPEVVVMERSTGMEEVLRSMPMEEIVEPLEVLAEDCPKPPSNNVDSEVANAASIAIILRCDDLSILMLGDCYPHNVVAYLRRKGYSEKNPLKVDFVKVSHHGSLHNTSNELLDLIKCNHYIISTNGEKFGHPDREAIAHILCHPTRNRDEKVHLYFNCDMGTLEMNSGRFIMYGEEVDYNFEIHECVSEINPPA